MICSYQALSYIRDFWLYATVKVNLQRQPSPMSCQQLSLLFFTDDGGMRNTTKSHLSQFIAHMDPDIICEISKPTVLVIDGCALLHIQYWPNTGTIDTSCGSYVRSAMRRKSPGLPASAVFDCYTFRTTKDQAQKWRRLDKSSPDMI